MALITYICLNEDCNYTTRSFNQYLYANSCPVCHKKLLCPIRALFFICDLIEKTNERNITLDQIRQVRNNDSKFLELFDNVIEKMVLSGLAYYATKDKIIINGPIPE